MYVDFQVRCLYGDRKLKHASAGIICNPEFTVLTQNTIINWFAEQTKIGIMKSSLSYTDAIILRNIKLNAFWNPI